MQVSNSGLKRKWKHFVKKFDSTKHMYFELQLFTLTHEVDEPHYEMVRDQNPNPTMHG
jgi:hypothetical protein